MASISNLTPSPINTPIDCSKSTLYRRHGSLGEKEAPMLCEMRPVRVWRKISTSSSSQSSRSVWDLQPASCTVTGNYMTGCKNLGMGKIMENYMHRQFANFFSSLKCPGKRTRKHSLFPYLFIKWGKRKRALTYCAPAPVSVSSGGDCACLGHLTCTLSSAPASAAHLSGHNTGTDCSDSGLYQGRDTWHSLVPATGHGSWCPDHGVKWGDASETLKQWPDENKTLSKFEWMDAAACILVKVNGESLNDRDVKDDTTSLIAN